MHHLNKGKNKCNYNIICPGADFIFGTHRNNIDNTNFCAQKPLPDHKSEIICQQKPTLEQLNKLYNYF